MAYRFATEQVDYTDFASGYVLHSAPGFPGFPVRLASEMFQRARARVPDRDSIVLWDALCGSGYLATVVGLLHRREIDFVLASDVRAPAVRLAARNLALLSIDGLEQRRRALLDLATRHGKPGHERAADAAARLAELLGSDLPGVTSTIDVFQPGQLPVVPDIVLSDVPYGEQTQWTNAPGDPVPAAIRAIASATPPHAVIALSARARKINLPPDIPVLERFRIGLRAVVLVRSESVSRR